MPPTNVGEWLGAKYILIIISCPQKSTALERQDSLKQFNERIGRQGYCAAAKVYFEYWARLPMLAGVAAAGLGVVCTTYELAVFASFLHQGTAADWASKVYLFVVNAINRLKLMDEC